MRPLFYIHGPLRLYLELKSFPIHADPCPAFHFNEDTDPAFENNADPCVSGSATLPTTKREVQLLVVLLYCFALVFYLPNRPSMRDKPAFK
jgi:hypothetical protein